MSELSAAAAAALGVPEAIALRSAAARAAETGMSVDEVLAAWAGGGAIDAPVAPSEPAAETVTDGAPVATQAEEAPAPAPAVTIEVPTAAPVGAAPATVSGRPPVLVGKPDRPGVVVAASIGLFMAVLLVGLVGPSLATENPGARTSALAFSESALHGRELYAELGCGGCHTQMVRPIISDVGLGAVTLNDSNQELGTRRYGPDLSDIGSRMTGSQIEAVALGLGSHPDASLSSDDLDDLTAYLLESKTSVAAPAQPDTPAEEPAEEEDGS